MRSFSLYSDCRWNGFSKTEELGKQLSFDIIYIHSLYMRTKSLILAKKIKNKAKNKLRHAKHKEQSI